MRQRARDVVEAARRIVGRQELRGVHFEPQHVANRVRVFGAVQAVEARRRQMGDRSCDRVRSPSSGSSDSSVAGIRAAACRSAASCLREVSGRPFRRFPHGRRGARDPACPAAGWPSSASRCGTSRSTGRRASVRLAKSGAAAGDLATSGRGCGADCVRATAFAAGAATGWRAAWPETRAADITTTQPAPSSLVFTDPPGRSRLNGLRLSSKKVLSIYADRPSCHGSLPSRTDEPCPQRPHYVRNRPPRAREKCEILPPVY